jgi:hypothetical protein
MFKKVKKIFKFNLSPVLIDCSCILQEKKIEMEIDKRIKYLQLFGVETELFLDF